MDSKFLSIALTCFFVWWLFLLIGPINIVNADESDDSNDDGHSYCVKCTLAIEDVIDQVNDVLTAMTDYLMDECGAMDSKVKDTCYQNAYEVADNLNTIFDFNYNDTWICGPACQRNASTKQTVKDLLGSKFFERSSSKFAETNKKTLAKKKAAIAAKAAAISDPIECYKCVYAAGMVQENAQQLLFDCRPIMLDACDLDPLVAENCLHAGKTVWWKMSTEFDSHFQPEDICKPVC